MQLALEVRATGGKRGKGAASSGGKKKVSVSSAKRGKWAPSTSSKKVPDDSVEEDKSGSFALYTMTVMTFLSLKNIIILKPWTSSNGQLSWLRTMPKAPSITVRTSMRRRQSVMLKTDLISSTRRSSRSTSRGTEVHADM